MASTLTFSVTKAATIMNARRWELVAAAVQAACAVGGAAYLVALGVAAEGAGSAERTPLDRVFPFALAAVLLLVLGVMTVRSLRRARALPTSPDARRTPDATPTPTATPPRPVAPVLSPEGRREVARLVRRLAAAGLFAPRVPDPDDLQEAVADAGEPVTPGAVLAGLWEAAYWRPGFRSDDHLDALAFHDGHVEQPAEVLRGQVDDLARLVGDALDIRLDDVALTDVGPAVRTRLRLSLAGRQQVLDYRGDAKNLSTVVHVAVARALRDATPAVRLAWLWTDQGVWLAALRSGVTPDDLGRSGDERWAWVDEAEPTAAGEVPGR